MLSFYWHLHLAFITRNIYNWTLLNTSTSTFYNHLINTFPDNNTVFINWGIAPPGTYQLSIHLENKHICCEGNGSILIKPLPKWIPYQDKIICEGDGAFLSAWPNPIGAAYNWNVSGGIPSSSTLNIFNPVFLILEII